MLWPGPLKGFMTSGLASSKMKVSDYGATALANHIPPSGAFSLAMAALECSVAEAWWNLVLFHSCMPQTAGKLLGAGGGKDLPLEGNVRIFTTSQGLWWAESMRREDCPRHLCPGTCGRQAGT